jgi:hypothetical protein
MAWKGLHNKFRVFRVPEHDRTLPLSSLEEVGTPAGTKGAVFVLRPETDPAAVVALRMYAVVTGNDVLGADLKLWLDTHWPAIPPPPGPAPEANPPLVPRG